MPKRATRNGTKKHVSGLTVRNARLDRARPFTWVWNQRVLAGYLNLQIGEEGIGKGNLTAWQSARITRGELEGDLRGEPRRVTIVGDEDAWDHIWVPRLKAAGANLRMVEQITAGGDGGTLNVREDAERILEYVEDRRPALMYFDQLLDNLGYTDTWKDKQIRDALAPLRRVADATGAAMLLSMHPNKRGGTFRERISGSPAFNALSRSSLLVAPHPDQDGRVVVVRAKGNYSIEPPAFEFVIEPVDLTVRGETITTSRIANVRQTGLTKDNVLDATASRRRSDSQAGQARTFLSEVFSNGQVLPAKDVLERAEAEGFNERVTQRARRELEIDTWQEGFQGPWMWGYRTQKIKMKGGRS